MLAITQKIVIQQGGEILAESEQGKGFNIIILKLILSNR